MAYKIILDTDIGDDIDDALALGLACRHPEIELVGVTTVFGNVDARSRQARTILALAGGGHERVPVAAGCGSAIAWRRPNAREQYLENHLPCQDASAWPESKLPPQERRHGVDFIIDTILAGNGDIIPVPIGAMTNIAMALVKEPRIIAKIPRIVAMAAEFERSMAEWNILCDPEAADIVFQSGIPIDVITWTMGDRVKFNEGDIARLAAVKDPLAENLSHAIALWQGDGPGHMPSLFDPLTMVALLEPDILQWREGKVSVEVGTLLTYGYTVFVPKEKGPHRVAFGVDRNRAIEFYFKTVLGA